MSAAESAKDYSFQQVQNGKFLAYILINTFHLRAKLYVFGNE